MINALLRQHNLVLRWGAVVVCGGWLSLRAAEEAPLPDWNELMSVVRTNLTTLPGAEIDRALTRGLLDQLRGEVMLVGRDSEVAAGAPALASSSVFEDAYAYLRVARVEQGVEVQVRDALDRMGATNKIQGVILDLRFASGFDYAAAAGIADRFVARDVPLLDWEGKVARSSSGTNDLAVPVAVVVNGATTGAPEALAAVLRETKAGLVIGSTTAGRANVFREYALSNGQKLRIASAKVRLGDGEPLPAGGVKPDIEVAVKQADEKAYWEDPWRTVGGGNAAPAAAAAASASSLRRINEAELMRQRREEIGDRGVEPARVHAPAPPKPALQDPALARALDLLKGLSILRQGKLR